MIERRQNTCKKAINVQKQARNSSVNKDYWNTLISINRLWRFYRFLGDLKDSKTWSSKNTKNPDPSKIILTASTVYKHVWFNRIHLWFKIINNYSRFTKIPQSCLPFLFKTLGDAICFGAIGNIIFDLFISARSNIDRQDLVGR